MTEFPGLVLAQHEGRLVASFRPSAPRPPLDLAVLRVLLADAGYGDWFHDEDALLTLVERCDTATAAFELVIGERRDAAMSLVIAADAMQASLDVTPAYGGKALAPDDIYLALGAAGISFGVDPAAVGAACAASAAERFVVAAGVPAEDGEDTRFDLLVADARDRAPQVDEHGLIDFRELGAIPTVSAGQPLMRRIPPTTGTAGRNVRGDVLEPLPGSNQPFADKLLGAHVADDDANLLRAVFSGQPVRCGNGVIVEPVLRLRNVNMATGNITFDGTVSIEGEVLPGMKVHATGDIAVGDVVDGAELDAGGDIRVAGGIIAKARVRAAGSVSARFVENAQVSAGTAIAIDDTALQSDLQANNQIVVGLKSTQRGRLAGGSARAMMLIRTPILGSPTGGVTSLLLGVNPVLDARYRELQQKIEKQREEENKLEKLVKHLARQGGPAAALLERAKASWQQALKAWARLLPERDDLERQLALIAGARVEVGASVAGAVDLSFGKKVLHLRNNYETGTLSIDGERIVFTDRAGKVTAAG
jgi:uncharacterized protein (DUF342 family)